MIAERAETALDLLQVDGERALRFMVVDDDPSINRLLQVRLRARGFEVESAASGDDALARLDEVRPDVLLCDVSMPGSSGLDVLERVRVEKRDLAVIISTAFGSEQVAIEALRRGADDYLRKPFQAVISRTTSRLRLSRQNAELRRQLDEKRIQLEAELGRAAEVQARLLPRVPPVILGFELVGRCIPAREVGGDFYDWQAGAADGVRITLGDVMGKGMAAALLMATVRAALRAVGPHRPPEATVSAVDLALQEDLGSSGSFVTLFHGRIDPLMRRLRYVDAGHGHAFLLRRGGQWEELRPRGLPLGVVRGLGYEEGSVDFSPGDSLVLYSDGLVDARPELCLEPALLAPLLHGLESAEEIAGRLLAIVDRAEPLPDDLTVMVLTCTNQGL